jgi:hypothetical protein
MEGMPRRLRLRKETIHILSHDLNRVVGGSFRQTTVIVETDTNTQDYVGCMTPRHSYDPNWCASNLNCSAGTCAC